MRRIETDGRILAVIYTDSDLVARVMLRLAPRLSAAGVRCAGFVQRDAPLAEGRSHCDMVLENLATGQRLKISEDRGAFARGCRLDGDVLATAIESACEVIHAGAEVLLVNKFGKTEAEGAGFRPVIADAIEVGVPVVIGVPWRNIESWRQFAGDFAIEISVDALTRATEEAALAGIGLELTAEPLARSGLEGGDRPNASASEICGE